jgi:predicted SnoaL-like aldol condensation-catalyzing enzyme
MPKTTPEQNKALVLEAFDTLFNRRDYAAAERLWSPNYIQHSAHIAPGRDGLFDLIKSIPPTLKYEPGTIVAEGDVVFVHGLRFRCSCELDCCRYCACRSRQTRGALGCHSR